MIRTYITLKNEELSLLENQYNFLIKNAKEVNFDYICLKKTQDIKKLREKNLSCISSEKLLREYREAAIQFIE